MIFDEPDSGLDPVRTALLCDLIQEMHSIYGGTYIVVTHNIASARQIGEYIALLWRGRIVEAGDAAADVLLGEPVRAPVPQRLRRGPADDGLRAEGRGATAAGAPRPRSQRPPSKPSGRLAPSLAICEHTFVWSSAFTCPASSSWWPPGGRRRWPGRALAVAPPPAPAGRRPASAWGRSRGRPRPAACARGMVLGEALARCPELVLVPPDPVGVAETWEETLRALESIGAAVEPAAPGLAYFQADGLRGLHGTRDGRCSRRPAARCARPARIGRRAHALLRAGGGPGGALAPAAGAWEPAAAQARRWLAGRPVGLLRLPGGDRGAGGAAAPPRRAHARRAGAARARGARRPLRRGRRPGPRAGLRRRTPRCGRAPAGAPARSRWRSATRARARRSSACWGCWSTACWPAPSGAGARCVP